MPTATDARRSFSRSLKIANHGRDAPPGVTLAGLVLNGLRGVNARLDGFDSRLRAVETGLAEIKGQLTIVRDYISGRNARGQETAEAGADE